VDPVLRRDDDFFLFVDGDSMSGEKAFFVYMLASDIRGTLYVGVTSDLVTRVWEHKTKAVPGFTVRYDVDRLVWFEVHETAEAAIQRERQIKEWKRDWKINLIERDNPHWTDLYSAWVPPERTARHPGEGRDPHFNGFVA
jgi:putative endonuclease